MPVNNDDDLMRILVSDMNSIIDSVSAKLIARLEEYIQSEVYNAYSPKVYERQGANGGLLGNWEQVPNDIRGNVITSIIRENEPTQLALDSDNFIHGSNFWSKDDIRDLLAEIVIMGKSGPLFGDGPWRFPRDFWTPFIKLLDDGTVDTLIETEFKKRGIKYIKL